MGRSKQETFRTKREEGGKKERNIESRSERHGRLIRETSVIKRVERGWQRFETHFGFSHAGEAAAMFHRLSSAGL